MISLLAFVETTMVLRRTDQGIEVPLQVKRHIHFRETWVQDEQSGKIFLSEFVTVVHANEKWFKTFLRYTQTDVEYFGERKNAYGYIWPVTEKRV